jgi:hypothetical protein
MRQYLSKCLGGRAIFAMCWLLTAFLLAVLIDPAPGLAASLDPASQHTLGMPDGIADDPSETRTHERPAAISARIESHALRMSRKIQIATRDDWSVSFLYARPSQARAPPETVA